MSEYSDIYRALAHVGLSGNAWGGNCVKGNGRWYLSDGALLLRASLCDPARVKQRDLLEPQVGRTGDMAASEKKAGDLLQIAEDLDGPEVTNVSAWGESTKMHAYPVCRFDHYGACFNAWLLRLALYVTLAEKMTLPIWPRGTRAVQEAHRAGVLWRNGQVAAVVMPLRSGDFVEWHEEPATEAASV